MKIIAAWVILMGLMSLILATVGQHVGILWFFEEFGVIPSYGLKIGLIVLGIWMWRTSEPAVEEEKSFEDIKSNWKPVIVGGVIVLIVALAIVFGSIRDQRLTREIAMQAKPAAWASKSPDKWPALVLMQKAEFKNHSSLEAGCASLVRLPNGQMVVLTAGHLLGKPGGVTPGFLQGGLGGLDNAKLATLDAEITSWKLFLPDDEGKSFRAQGLFGNPKKFDEDCDQILLRVTQTNSNWPVKPIDIRIKPVEFNEKLFVIAPGLGKDGNIHQKIYKAKRTPGLGFNCELEKSATLQGCSGAPVVDAQGLLVGIVTGGSLRDFANQNSMASGFSGHTVSELMPVLRDAWDDKPASKVVAKR